MSYISLCKRTENSPPAVGLGGRTRDERADEEEEEGRGRWGVSVDFRGTLCLGSCLEEEVEEERGGGVGSLAFCLVGLVVSVLALFALSSFGLSSASVCLIRAFAAASFAAVSFTATASVAAFPFGVPFEF